MEKGSHNCFQNNQVNATICQETDCKCDLSVVSDLKTARMPNCCRQQQRCSDTPFT